MSPIPVVYGGAVAAVLLLLGWQPWRRASERPIGPLTSALAAPAAALTALYANASSVKWPPREYLDWVFLASALAVGFVAFRGRRAVAAGGLFVLGAAVLAYFPTRSLHVRYWGDDRLLWLGALVGAFTASYWIAGSALHRRAKGDGAAALAIAALGAAPALGLSGTGGAALVAAAVGAAALLVAALGWLRQDLRLGEGLAPPFAALHCGLLASGVLYAETPRWSALALVLAPALVLLPGTRPRARLARLALVLVVVVGAVWTARAPANPYAGY